MNPVEIAEQLRSKLQRKVSNLSVEFNGDQAILKGNSPSYYLKQLAQEEIRSLVNGRRIINRISVA
jgi:hypothetical protein